MKRSFEHNDCTGWVEWSPEKTDWETVFNQIKWQIDISYEGRIAWAAKVFDPISNTRWEWERNNAHKLAAE